jgi:hypothetical protein
MRWNIGNWDWTTGTKLIVIKVGKIEVKDDD